jgi:hypothetical protein
MHSGRQQIIIDQQQAVLNSLADAFWVALSCHSLPRGAGKSGGWVVTSLHGRPSWKALLRINLVKFNLQMKGVRS